MYEHLAAHYDALMDDVDYGAWAAYIDSFLKEAGARRIAEAACGTGALTTRLCAMGYEMTASDVSEAMISAAQKNARAAGVSPRFCVQDMRALDIPRRDALVCACDGVNYLTADGDAAAFFAAAYRTIKPGGLLLFDISSAHKLRNVLHGACFFDDRDDETCLWSCAMQKNLLHMDVTIFSREGELYSRRDETHLQRAYDAGELEDLLVNTGFCDIMTYDFSTRQPPRSDSGRIQFFARRPRVV